MTDIKTSCGKHEALRHLMTKPLLEKLMRMKLSPALCFSRGLLQPRSLVKLITARFSIVKTSFLIFDAGNVLVRWLRSAISGVSYFLSKNHTASG